MYVFWVNVLYLGAATIITYAVFLVFMPVFWGWWESSLALMAFAIVLFQLPRLKSGQFARSLALTGVVGMIGATILSPSLWLNLHVPLASMAEAREWLVAGQVGNTNADTALIERVKFLFESTVSSRVMYMETASFDVPPYHELIRAYEASPFRGRTGSWTLDGLIALLALGGMIGLIRRADSPAWFALVLLVVTGVVLPVLIPLFWQRYYLIMQIPYLYMVGVGAVQVWSYFSTRLRTV